MFWDPSDANPDNQTARKKNNQVQGFLNTDIGRCSFQHISSDKRIVSCNGYISKLFSGLGIYTLRDIMQKDKIN